MAAMSAGHRSDLSGRSTDAVAAFTEFAREAERRLRPALVSFFGAERGREATQDALIYAWTHWDKIEHLDNPHGYLFRVGQRAAKRSPRREVPALQEVPVGDTPAIEPGLDGALDRLSPMQRAAVLLVKAFEHTHAEAAEVLGVRPSSVQKHLERALVKLRSSLGVMVDD